MAGINLGTIYARLLVEDGMSAVLSRAASGLDSFSKKADHLGSRLQSAGGAMTAAITVPVVALGAAIIKTGADFDRAMNMVNAVMAPTAVEMKVLRESALQMGRDTVFSATDAATALGELGKAGLTVQESLSAATPVLQLAAASGLDMARAAEISARAMRAFGLDTTELVHLNDVLAKAVNLSTLEIEDIATAFKYVGPIATSFGLSVETTTAALATMRDAGIAAETTGRGLREGIERLVNPVKAVHEVMGQLGISTFMSGGKLMSLSDIVGLLESKGLTAAQSLKMFGDAAGPGMYALVSRGRVALDELTLSLKKSDGTAQRMADAMMTGLPGALERLRGSVETALIALKTGFEPTILTTIGLLERAADTVTNVLVPAFMSLPAPVQSGITWLIGLAAAFGPVLLALGSFIRVIGFAVGGLAPLATGIQYVISALFFGTATSAGAGIIATLGALTFALYKTAEGAKYLWAAWQEGRLIEALTAQDKDNWLRRLAGFDTGNDPRKKSSGGKGGVISPGALAGGAAAARVRDELANMKLGYGLGGGGGGGVDDEALKKAQEWKSFLDDLSGSDAIAEAEKWMRALADPRIGGLGGLTPDKQKQLHGILDDAMVAYQTLGQLAPAAMAKVWAATVPTPGVVSRFDSAKNALQGIGEEIHAIAPFLGAPGVVTGLGGLGQIGTQVPIGPMPKGPSFLKDAFGSAGAFGADLSQTIMSAITGGGSIVNAVSGLFGGGLMKGVVKGFSASFASTFIGGALSSILPGLGALVGPLMEKLLGHFMKPEWKKIMSGVGRDWGVNISEGLAKSIETDAKRLNSRFAATLLHIGEIVKEGGGVEKFGLEKTITKTRDLFVEVGQKAITTKEAATAMGSIFPQIADVIVKSNKIASASFVELITLNKQFGLDTKEILDFVASQATRAGEGIVKLLGPLSQQKELTAESAVEFERLGVLALATFNASVAAGTDWVTALQQVSPALQSLLEIQTNLGLTTENAALQQLLHYQALVTANETLVLSAGALNETMLALSNIGGLNITTLQALEAQGIATFDRLIAAGFSETESLMMMKGFLENVILAHQQMGIPIDENIAKLILLAEQNGVLSAQQLSTNDILMQGFAALIEAVGGQLPEAFMKMRDAAVAASADVTNAVNSIPRDVGVAVHVGDGVVPSTAAEAAWRGGMVMSNRIRRMAGGGFIAHGTDTVPAMLTPGEGVVNVRGMSALGEDGLNALNNGGGVGGGTVRNSFVINNPVMDSEARVEELAEAIARRIYNGGGVRTSWGRALKGLA
jgi:TP901 family phage tail tape measure protein